MSLISASRSLPEAWIVLANSVCLRAQVAVRVAGELVGQDQQAVQRRAQLVGHVRQELRLVLGGQGELLGLLLEGRAGLLDFLVLLLDLDVLLGQQGGLLLELLVGLPQLFLLRLQLSGQRLGLLQQVLRAGVGLDRVEHDADATPSAGPGDAWCAGLKRSKEASSSTALTSPSKSTGQDDDVGRAPHRRGPRRSRM